MELVNRDAGCMAVHCEFLEGHSPIPLGKSGCKLDGGISHELPIGVSKMVRRISLRS
jgi:hypothetical protein